MSFKLFVLAFAFLSTADCACPAHENAAVSGQGKALVCLVVVDGGRTFYRSGDRTTNFDEAKASCESEGMVLPSNIDQVELDAVSAVISSGYWIGARTEQNATFVWLEDGEEIDTDLPVAPAIKADYCVYMTDSNLSFFEAPCSNTYFPLCVAG